MTNKNKIHCIDCKYGKTLMDGSGECHHPASPMTIHLPVEVWTQECKCPYGRPKENNGKDIVYVVVGRNPDGAIIMTESFIHRQDAEQRVQNLSSNYKIGSFQIKAVEFPKPEKPKKMYKVYNIGFMNPETGVPDETQFDVEKFEELLELFKDFSKENYFKKDPIILYIDFVGHRKEED